MLASDGGRMRHGYTAVVKKSGDWWFGWVQEVPGVNCQERTREELLGSLRVTLKEALEFNRRDALDAAGEVYDARRPASPSPRTRLRPVAGGSASFVVAQSKEHKRSAVPRHNEIVDQLANKICKDLGTPE
jgi:hypothetical protein